MKCKHCGREFHYCSSCDPDLSMSEGCCCDACLNVFYDLERFDEMFENFLKKCQSPFEKDVLYESEQDLWESWIYVMQKKYKQLGISE